MDRLDTTAIQFVEKFRVAGVCVGSHGGASCRFSIQEKVWRFFFGSWAVAVTSAIQIQSQQSVGAEFQRRVQGAARAIDEVVSGRRSEERRQRTSIQGSGISHQLTHRAKNRMLRSNCSSEGCWLLDLVGWHAIWNGFGHAQTPPSRRWGPAPGWRRAAGSGSCFKDGAENVRI